MSVPEGLPPMEYRFLGRSGLKVSALSLGGWLTYGGHVEEAAYDIGVNFFDCAETYSAGESERVMGRAINKFGWKRNDLVISTKIYWGSAFGDNPVNNVGLSRKHIVEGTNAALERLGLSYVDLIYAHRADRDTPMEETVRAFNHIIETGLTTFSPLKLGILTGKYNDGVPKDSRLGASTDKFVEGFNKNVGDEKWQKEIEIVKNLKPIADKLEVTQAALALAWVLRNKNVSSAITGASRPEQVYESAKAFAVVKKLTPEILDEIDVVLGNKPPVLVRRY
ncbi:putative Voltage-gated potassium channel subunit beta-1 [Glarea lozoyensis 74030]|uniref:Putative Voltage-gated potassium channel subunit beta-1 n=1 Tax=Glarea lozoyensis (strain ATCC 74030 / MF5533) TaxID=1104152 RepID=H0EZ57_GLAL7|nr:putative Voltage-gated potassium channel subunit beta-1 [Glarea lozoyensis 74030]